MLPIARKIPSLAPTCHLSHVRPGQASSLVIVRAVPLSHDGYVVVFSPSLTFISVHKHPEEDVDGKDLHQLIGNKSIDSGVS